jgi:hypothetical protein
METSDSCGIFPGQAFPRFMAAGNNLETCDSWGASLPFSGAGALFLQRTRELETSETLKPHPAQAFSRAAVGGNNLKTCETDAPQGFHKNHKVSPALNPLRSPTPQRVPKNHKFFVFHVRLW